MESLCLQNIIDLLKIKTDTIKKSKSCENLKELYKDKNNENNENNENIDNNENINLESTSTNNENMNHSLNEYESKFDIEHNYDDYSFECLIENPIIFSTDIENEQIQNIQNIQEKDIKSEDIDNLIQKQIEILALELKKQENDSIQFGDSIQFSDSAEFSDSIEFNNSIDSNNLLDSNSSSILFNPFYFSDLEIEFGKEIEIQIDDSAIKILKESTLTLYKYYDFISFLDKFETYQDERLNIYEGKLCTYCLKYFLNSNSNINSYSNSQKIKLILTPEIIFEQISNLISNKISESLSTYKETFSETIDSYNKSYTINLLNNNFDISRDYINAFITFSEDYEFTPIYFDISQKVINTIEKYNIEITGEFLEYKKLLKFRKFNSVKILLILCMEMSRIITNNTLNSICYLKSLEELNEFIHNPLFYLFFIEK